MVHNWHYRERAMEVKNAVAKAVIYVRELFEHDNLTNLGLEEVFLDDEAQEWVITVGFSRPWDYTQHTGLAELAGAKTPPKRSFKMVRINDTSEEVVSVRNWAPPSSDALPF